jgi:hypothetical protein
LIRKKNRPPPITHPVSEYRATPLFRGDGTPFLPHAVALRDRRGGDLIRKNMKEYIKIIGKDIFLINKEILGLDEAQLWIGKADGPADNDDERVARERAEEEKHKGEPNRRPFGIEAQNIRESEKNPGWHEVNVSAWPIGIYRFNVHGKANVEALNGTSFRPIRDGQYSWPNYSDEELIALDDSQKDFFYLERNNAGFCFRLEITADREIKPVGDGRKWLAKWPEIRKKVDEHYQEKMKK